MEDWRSLLYPLGFIAAFIFGARFIVQWLQSEKAKKSVLPLSFWRLSLAGNFLLALHSFIQIQYHVCLVQACNAIISWRNIELLQKKGTPVGFKTIVLFLFGTFFLVSAAFYLQDIFLTGDGNWFHSPAPAWEDFSTPGESFTWHLLGSLGYFLFSLRFWIQWWLAEKRLTNQLPPIFWWLSLCGALLSAIYFIKIGDSVNLIGPVAGIVPYVRNLMLIYKLKTADEQ